MREKKELATRKKRGKTANKKTSGVYVRLTDTEKKQLKTISKQSGISVSHLLRTGALGQLDQLPRFRQLPGTVMAELTKLDRLTTAMWYLSQRADQDAVYAQDIRAIVYEVGAIVSQIKHFCQANVSRQATLTQVRVLIENVQELSCPCRHLGRLTEQLQALYDSFQTHSPV